MSKKKVMEDLANGESEVMKSSATNSLNSRAESGFHTPTESGFRGSPAANGSSPRDLASPRENGASSQCSWISDDSLFGRDTDSKQGYYGDIDHTPALKHKRYYGDSDRNTPIEQNGFYGDHSPVSKNIGSYGDGVHSPSSDNAGYHGDIDHSLDSKQTCCHGDQPQHKKQTCLIETTGSRGNPRKTMFVVLPNALLADLQSTTSHIANYQQHQQQTQQNPPHHHKSSLTSTVKTTVDDYTDNPDGQPENVYPDPNVIKTLKSNSTNTVTTTVTRTQHSAQPLALSPESPTRDLRALPSNKPMSLSNNLSELDSLLQDLSSAQFMAEVDRRNAANMANGGGNGGNGRPGGERSVDSLLNELENFPPPPQSPSHYEQINPQKAGAASSARELDDLMQSLSDLKNKGVNHEGDPPYAQVNKMPRHQAQHAQPQNLEAMLGNLSTDMNKHGIDTAPKGHCAACTKPIVGQVITALGKIWHPEHFVCCHCKEELGTQNFFERNSQPYCERDYHNLFSPRCAACNGPILDKCVTANDKTWHPEHFSCAACGQPFGEEGFHEKDGKSFCRNDYFQLFAPQCGGCNHPIMDNYISALNRQWHPECFVCQECRMVFGGASFYDHEGFPYCETHYHAKRGSLCAGCHKPITGRCITAMYKKFHPEHFVCAFCLKQLNKGTFKEQNDKPYCHPCFVKLFG